MSILSKIGDAFLRLFGLKKDPPKPPHEHYWNPYQGYFAYDEVTLRGATAGFDAALVQVAEELNRGVKEAGLPYRFSVTTTPAETVLVQWDHTGRIVPRGEDATTPSEFTAGVRPDIPQAVKHANVYVRSGKSGDYLYRLLLHEIFAHARTHMGQHGHSDDDRDVGHPSAKASRLSTADLTTWAKSFQRRQQDGLG